MGDFDFLMGKWAIRHHRLKQVMQNCDAWDTFETGYEAWQLLGGLANADRVFGQVNGAPFEGASVRSFDPRTGEWTIYWMDIWNTRLREQARGRFGGGVGKFFGTEVHQGVSYPMRFLWKDIRENSARWEQAYQEPRSAEWETNWIMDFARVAD